MTDPWQQFASVPEPVGVEPAIVRAVAANRGVAITVFFTSLGLITGFVVAALVSWSELLGLDVASSEVVGGVFIASAILGAPLPVVIVWAARRFSDEDLSNNVKQVLFGKALSGAAESLGLPPQVGWLQVAATALFMSVGVAALFSYWV